MINAIFLNGLGSLGCSNSELLLKFESINSCYDNFGRVISSLQGRCLHKNRKKNADSYSCL
jgi:hypothetical protein